MQNVKRNDPGAVLRFITELLSPNVDARIFEIVTFSVLKEFYANQAIYWGWSPEAVNKEFLMLYKTGRCNANDGGIDFVMRPLGRFFQVTETTDVRKYFLDIDKVQRYPITFVVKSNDPTNVLLDNIRNQAEHSYGVAKVVERYMECVEEVVNIPILLDRLNSVANEGCVAPIMDEIIVQSKVEFNYEDDVVQPWGQSLNSE